MLSLKEMKEFGVHQLCADLCKNIINSQYPDGSELKLLLPIKYVLSDWSLRGSVDWKNPMTGEEFVLPYFWEHQRVANIDIINKEIDKYNAKVDELDSKYDDLEERVKDQPYQKRNHYPKYNLTVWNHSPVHQKLPERIQKQPFDARHFENKEIYIRLNQCKSEEETVGRFNKMLYEYIIEVTKGKTLIEGSTFYYPFMEFEDYITRQGTDYPNLLEEEVTTEEFWHNNIFDSITLEEVDGIPDYKIKRDDGGAGYTPEIFTLEMDWDNRTITASLKLPPNEDGKSDTSTQTASFRECGLIGKQNKPNRYAKLLCQWAYYKQESQDKPFIDKERLFNDIVVGDRKKNTFNKYQNALDILVSELLHIQLLDDGDIFYKVKGKEEFRGATGRTIKKTITFLDTDLNISLKKYSEELRETTRDGFLETYSSDTKPDVE